jgi:hypothetical protein
MPTRRSVLTGLGAGLLGSLIRPGRAVATPPSGLEGYNVLEIFLGGGVSHRETFWHQPGVTCDRFGYIDGIDWSGLTDGWQPSGVNVAVHDDMDPDKTNGFVFSPCIRPLLGTPFLDNYRVVHTQHTLTPHVVAQPYMLGGQTPGRERYAGSAAVANLAYATSDVLAGWVLDANPGSSLGRHAAASGLLGTTYRPPVIPFTSKLDSFLDRLGQPDAAEQQALLSLYADRYDEALRFSGGGTARSEGFQDFTGVQDTLFSRLEIAETLQDAIYPPGQPGVYLAPNTDDMTSRAIRAGARLIHQGSARYVAILDQGNVVIDGKSFGRDSHARGDQDSWTRHAEVHNLSAWRIFQTLRAAYDGGYLDPAKTLVVLNTEFGRSPDQGLKECPAAADPMDAGGYTSWGSYHWPSAFTVLLLGGPFLGRRVLGNLSYETDEGESAGGVISGSDFVDPEDLRVAINAVLGKDSGDLDLFGVGSTPVNDVRAAMAF